MAIELQIGAFVYLKRGDPFKVTVQFDYMGHLQMLTFGLVMKQGLTGTEYPCVPYPTGDVEGAVDWKRVGPDTLSYKVPSGVKNGSQDIRMHITTEDGKEEYSGWLTDVFSIS